ncbi:MAG: pantetheine-phosphate adenylyltransferase [Proteobacteria bacterium]|nr:pantetheine-phosphate adenylyltransferase [Pseudomonadota bacterium]
MQTVAIYPGSFDPLTNGHVDIINRAYKIFDKIIVAILYNVAKKPLFTIEERIDMIKNCTKEFPNIEVDHFGGLLIEYAHKKKVTAIIRGMRVVSDFENEFQMAMMNRSLNRDIQTIFLMTGLRWVFISSSTIKEVASFGGDVSNMVPPYVNTKLAEKFSQQTGQ